jgi:peptidyl-prolyl cis-trans isomerase B (cyclophilin B)
MVFEHSVDRDHVTSPPSDRIPRHVRRASPVALSLPGNPRYRPRIASPPLHEETYVENPNPSASGTNAALAAIDQFIADQAIDTARSGWRLSLPRPPAVAFDDGSKYFWRLETSHGTMTVRLMADVAPMHVSSTIYLTRLGFYDGLSFHRVITGFMAQGGCPRGSGTGGPGYQYDGECDPAVRHDRPGLLSMANAGPGTDGSQFFLTFVPTPWLDGNHTIFGEVVEGTETLKALEQRGSQSGRPSEPLEIQRATIEVR